MPLVVDEILRSPDLSDEEINDIKKEVINLEMQPTPEYLREAERLEMALRMVISMRKRHK
jgi:hypothetical protein